MTNGHVGRHIGEFDGVHGRCGLSRNVFRALSEERILCVEYIVTKEEKSKVTFRIGENETENDFVMKKI